MNSAVHQEAEIRYWGDAFRTGSILSFAVCGLIFWVLRPRDAVALG